MVPEFNGFFLESVEFMQVDGKEFKKRRLYKKLVYFVWWTIFRRNILRNS